MSESIGSSDTARRTPDECLLDDDQKDAIDRILASDEVPSDVKQIARDTARKWGYDPSIGGDPS